jgi:hypothetical protein
MDLLRLYNSVVVIQTRLSRICRRLPRPCILVWSPCHLIISPYSCVGSADHTLIRKIVFFIRPLWLSPNTRSFSCPPLSWRAVPHL